MTSAIRTLPKETPVKIDATAMRHFALESVLAGLSRVFLKWGDETEPLATLEIEIDGKAINVLYADLFGERVLLAGKSVNNDEEGYILVVANDDSEWCNVGKILVMPYGDYTNMSDIELYELITAAS